MAVRTHQVSVVQVQIGRPPRQTLPPRREVLHESVPRLCPVDVRQHQKSPVLNTNLVGGPGFEPGASRSRTVLVMCPLVSRRLRRCPPELKLPLLGVRPCPPRAAWCRESVPRLCPGACLNAVTDPRQNSTKYRAVNNSSVGLTPAIRSAR